MKLREDLDRLTAKALDLKEGEERYSGIELPDGTWAIFDWKENDYKEYAYNTKEKVLAKVAEMNDLQTSLDNLEKEKQADLIQCVIKVQDIGNAYKFIGIKEDKSDYLSQYDVDNEYNEGEQDPTILYVLCYHNDGENIFFNEEGEELDLDMEEHQQFEKDYQDAINSQDNTVIADKDMLESVEFVSDKTAEAARKGIDAIEFVLSTYGMIGEEITSEEEAQIKTLEDAKELLRSMVPELQ